MTGTFQSCQQKRMLLVLWDFRFSRRRLWRQLSSAFLVWYRRFRDACWGIIRVIIALIMEAVSTSETSVNLNQTARRNNPEGSCRYCCLYCCGGCDWVSMELRPLPGPLSVPQMIKSKYGAAAKLYWQWKTTGLGENCSSANFSNANPTWKYWRKQDTWRRLRWLPWFPELWREQHKRAVFRLWRIWAGQWVMVSMCVVFGMETRRM
jgi:hypothetical protein